MPPGARCDAHYLRQPPHWEKAEAAVLCRLYPPFDCAPACLGQALPQRDTLYCRMCVGTVCRQPFWDGESTVRVLAGCRAGLLRLPALLGHYQLCGGGALSPLYRKSSVVSAAFGGTGSFLYAVHRLLLCCTEAPGLDGGQPDALYRTPAVSRTVFLCVGIVYSRDRLQLFCPHCLSGGSRKAQYAAAPASDGFGGAAVHPVRIPPSLPGLPGPGGDAIAGPGGTCAKGLYRGSPGALRADEILPLSNSA